MEKFELTKQELEQLIETAVAKALNAHRPENGSEFLTRTQAAKALGVTLTTLYVWDKQGILPAKRLGKKVFYTAKDINDFFTTRPQMQNKSKGY